MERYSRERVHELEAAIAGMKIHRAYGVRDNDFTSAELHVVLRIADAEARVIYTECGVDVDRSAMADLADELSWLLGFRVEIYAGENKPGEDFPRCGCVLVSETPVGAQR